MMIYVKSIGNVNKKQYAKCYVEFLLGTRRDHPLREGFSPLSYMAAQAVRATLEEIYLS